MKRSTYEETKRLATKYYQKVGIVTVPRGIYKDFFKAAEARKNLKKEWLKARKSDRTVALLYDWFWFK